MRESAGRTALPLSAMGSPRYSARAWTDTKMDGHTPTKRRGKGEEDMDALLEDKNVYVCVFEKYKKGGGCYCAIILEWK